MRDASPPPFSLTAGTSGLVARGNFFVDRRRLCIGLSLYYTEGLTRKHNVRAMRCTSQRQRGAGSIERSLSLSIAWRFSSSDAIV